MLAKQSVLFALLITSIDAVWLKYVMGPLYNRWLSDLGLSVVMHIPSILIAYTLMISAYPLLIHESKGGASELYRAVVVGLLVYGIYGFTVAAVFPKYGVQKALLETVWGMTIYLTCTWLTRYIGQWIF